MSADFDLVDSLKEAILEADKARDKKQLLENNAPGLRPHPKDSHNSVLGGTSVSLGPVSGKFDGMVRNKSVYITEWTVKIKPSASGISKVGDLNSYGMRALLTVAYDGEQSLEYQPGVNPTLAPYILPLVGKCFVVHGREITLQVERDPGGATVDIDMELAIVPGRPMFWYVAQDDSAAMGDSAVFEIPVFAQRVSLLTNISLNDTFEFLDTAGNSLGLFTATANNLNWLQPIQPLAAFLRYNTADVSAKVVVANFEIFS